MARFEIEGGIPISGRVTPAGSKNAIFPILAATLLAKDTYHFSGVPAITDVKVMLRLMESFGVKYFFMNRGEDLVVDTTQLHEGDIDTEQFAKIRGSVVLLGSLASQFAHVQAVYPGGDKIGVRSMMAHFDGLTQSGYAVEEHPDAGWYKLSKQGDFGDKHIFMYEVSVTGTENVILANVIGEGHLIEIYNAASEPHVKDLCIFLKKMGADIEGEGTNRIRIRQVKALHGASHTIGKDILYVTTFIVFALMTHGELYIEDVTCEDLLPVFVTLKYFNVHWKLEGTTLYIPANQHLCLNKDFNIYSNVGIYTHPWPNLPTDMLPMFVALATQSEGEFLFFEQMYANRIGYTEGLKSLGADVQLLDPHRIIVRGKTPLSGGTLTCPDIRTGTMYLASMLASTGHSILNAVQHIERGYPHIEQTLSLLGAHIQKYEDSL